LGRLQYVAEFDEVVSGAGGHGGAGSCEWCADEVEAPRAQWVFERAISNFYIVRAWGAAVLRPYTELPRCNLAQRKFKSNTEEFASHLLR
jgi:hypothetical protein